MRINRFIAQVTGLSRRAADTAIAQGQVLVNGTQPTAGHDVTADDIVSYQGKTHRLSQAEDPTAKLSVLLNKPAGYVVSRQGQGSKTIYDLLPPTYRHLKPVGRLDKDSSGLLLITNDGDLAHQLTHPGQRKVKIYEISLDTPLQPLHRQMVQDHGILLDDGNSRLIVERMHDTNEKDWRITMHEGRNRQIRRTFAALGYTVTKLHRTDFGPYNLGDLPSGGIQAL